MLIECMLIAGTASAGTLESSDVMITLEQGNNGIEIALTSTVEKQYGTQIRKIITETLEGLGAKDIKVIANDRGALDCTIKARVSAAWFRATNTVDYNWEV